MTRTAGAQSFGRFLDEALVSAGTDRSEADLTSCGPPKTPTAEL